MDTGRGCDLRKKDTDLRGFTDLRAFFSIARARFRLHKTPSHVRVGSGCLEHLTFRSFLYQDESRNLRHRRASLRRDRFHRGARVAHQGEVNEEEFLRIMKKTNLF